MRALRAEAISKYQVSTPTFWRFDQIESWGTLRCRRIKPKPEQAGGEQRVVSKTKAEPFHKYRS
jgi:hypothetical protein